MTLNRRIVFTIREQRLGVYGNPNRRHRERIPGEIKICIQREASTSPAGIERERERKAGRERGRKKNKTFRVATRCRATIVYFYVYRRRCEISFPIVRHVG